MPNVTEDEQALKSAASAVGTQSSDQIASVLGINREDLTAYNHAISNPDDPNSIPIKNVIFQKIAAVRPAQDLGRMTTGGAKVYERLWAKNVLDQDPKVQETYFQKKGYETRYFKGNLEVRKPEDINFAPVDPDKIDAFDAFDVIGDTFEGIAAGVAQAAGTFAGSAASLNPVVGAAAGYAASGAVTATSELAKQAIGVLTGVRDKFDEGAVVKAGAIGALVPAAIKGGSLLLKGVNKGIDKVVEMATEKPLRALSADTTEAAAKTLGVTARPEQIFNDRAIAQASALIDKNNFTVFGILHRKTAVKNEQTIDATLNNLYLNLSGDGKIATGQQASKEILDEIHAKAAAAENIYNTFGALFDNKLTKPDLTSVSDFLKSRIKNTANDREKTLAENYLEKLDGVKNLTDLKEVRSAVGADIDPLVNADKQARLMATGMYKRLTAARSKTINGLTDMAQTDGAILLPKGSKLLELIQMSGKGRDFFKFAGAELKKADAAWGDIFRTADDLGMGKKLSQRYTGKEVVDEYFNNMKVEKIADMIFDVNDFKKLGKMQARFPDQFEALREQKLKSIFDKSTTQVQSGPDKFTPRKLAQNLQNLDPKTREIIFGQDKDTMEAIMAWGKSNPRDINPSGTGITAKLLVNPISYLPNFSAAVASAKMWAKTRNIAPGTPSYIETFANALDKELGFKSTLGDIVSQTKITTPLGVAWRRSVSGEDGRKDLLPDAAMGILPEYNKQGWR